MTVSKYAGGLRHAGEYLTIVTICNLIWETSHLPLYTLWKEGSLHEIVFAVIHCTIGDLLIALATLTAAIFVTNSRGWPARGFWPVALITTIFGLAYTAFSEWLNVSIKSSWQYSEMMPVFQAFGFEFGASPLLQWIIIPAFAFFCVSRWRQKSARRIDCYSLH